MNRCGSVFRVYDEENQDQGLFLLAQVAPFKVCLVGLNPGANRWSDPLEVQNIDNLSKREMCDIGLNENCVFLGIMQADGTIGSTLKAFFF